MAPGFLEWVAGAEARPKEAGGYSIATGKVVDNQNLLSEGRVQVHMSAFPDFDPWARLVAVGGGSSRGFLWLPEVGDEVLVAFNQNDERDAYVLGGLWSAMKRPPVSDPVTVLAKRVIRTGKENVPSTYHEIELDDLLQSITIKTVAAGRSIHEISMDVKKVEISALSGALKISLSAGPPPAITLEATAGNIELKSPGKISLNGTQVEIQSKTTLSLTAIAACSIQGTPLKLN